MEIENEAIPEERRNQQSLNAATHAASEYLSGSDNIPPNAIRGLPPGISVRGNCVPLKPGSRPFLKTERQCWLYAIARDDGWLGWNPMPKEPRRVEVEETRWFDAKAIPTDSWVAEAIASLGEMGLMKALQMHLSLPHQALQHHGGPMLPPSPMGMNGGYDPSLGFHGGDPNMHLQQYSAGYGPQQQQQWFGQQGGGYPPFHQVPFEAMGIPGGGAGAPNMEEERLRFTFPVTILSLNVVSTGKKPHRLAPLFLRHRRVSHSHHQHEPRSACLSPAASSWGAPPFPHRL